MNQLANNLEDLAQRINNHHGQAVEALRNSLEHARQAGELLIEAKALVAHGGWLPWIADNCQFSDRTARAYMQVARNWNQLEESATVANMTYKQALGLLAAPPAEYEYHEYNKIFPTDKGVIESIAADMRRSGYQKELPIVLYEGKILDGKLRYEAAKLAGVEPVFINFPEDCPHYKGNALQFSISANVKRQQLSEDQRAAIAVYLRRYLENLERTAEQLFSEAMQAETLDDIGLVMDRFKDHDFLGHIEGLLRELDKPIPEDEKPAAYSKAMTAASLGQKVVNLARYLSIKGIRIAWPIYQNPLETPDHG